MRITVSGLRRTFEVTDRAPGLRAALRSIFSRSFREIVARADRQTGSALIEGILLIVALLFSWLRFHFVAQISVGGWEEFTSAGAVQTSWSPTEASTSELELLYGDFDGSESLTFKSRFTTTFGE